ncbi:KpsF/GutQ family sugar-phosphate isomerase [Pirellulales bacterium]|nr:KpsF/GutQ family sugar-phosphate isomerase [Pirellulales bacterium]
MSYHAATSAYSAGLPSTTPPSPVTDAETVELGRQVIAAEARALVDLLGRVDNEFAAAVAAIRNIRGSLIVTGIGKAGLIAQKLAATFASTGTRTHFLHPAEAFHGDLGRVGPDDCVLALSYSGETSEVVQLLNPLRRRGIVLVAITRATDSTLGRAADVALPLGDIDEACSLGLAPSTSTTAMLALGDALALTLSRINGFEAEDFAKFHPGGSLGFKLSPVDDLMRSLDDCRVACESQTVRRVLAAACLPGRRTGAVMLTDGDGRLTGIFTDSDLARLFEHRNDAALDMPIRMTMANAPTTIPSGALMDEAIAVLVERKISELPVVDQDHRPIGMIDVTDVLGGLPEAAIQPELPADAATVRLYYGDESPETD